MHTWMISYHHKRMFMESCCFLYFIKTFACHNFCLTNVLQTPPFSPLTEYFSSPLFKCFSPHQDLPEIVPSSESPLRVVPRVDIFYVGFIFMSHCKIWTFVSRTHVFLHVFAFVSYFGMCSISGKPDTTSFPKLFFCKTKDDACFFFLRCWNWKYYDVIQEKYVFKQVSQFFYMTRLGYLSLVGAPGSYGMRKFGTGCVN